MGRISPMARLRQGNIVEAKAILSQADDRKEALSRAEELTTLLTEDGQVRRRIDDGLTLTFAGDRGVYTLKGVYSTAGGHPWSERWTFGQESILPLTERSDGRLLGEELDLDSIEYNPGERRWATVSRHLGQLADALAEVEAKA